MSNSTNRSRRQRRAQKRAATTLRARTAEMAAVQSPEPPATPESDTATDWDDSYPPVESAAPVDALPPATGSLDDSEDAPTIILTPDQIAMLSRSTPPALPPTVPPPASDFAYDPQSDSPTIVLDVGALFYARQEKTLAPPKPAPTTVRPQPPLAPLSGTPTRRRTVTPIEPEGDPARPRHQRIEPEEDLARLRRQRIEREHEHPAPAESDLSRRLKQWWHDLQPGIDRVLGRAHHGGTRGARDTVRQTSAQLPAVRVRSRSDQPQARPHSPAARELGHRAQTAATPALEHLHARAERAAQALVDRLEEHLGGRPPMQHVLLGPGRMIVSFLPSITIRDAQIIIASVQARSLRRLIGYNAYLVLVPPGREAIYAGRLQGYREVTGVHFGTARSAGRMRVAARG
jgi:hypothetical protein